MQNLINNEWQHFEGSSYIHVSLAVYNRSCFVTYGITKQGIYLHVTYYDHGEAAPKLIKLLLLFLFKNISVYSRVPGRIRIPTLFHDVEGHEGWGWGAVYEA